MPKMLNSKPIMLPGSGSQAVQERGWSGGAAQTTSLSQGPDCKWGSF